MVPVKRKSDHKSRLENMHNQVVGCQWQYRHVFHSGSCTLILFCMFCAMDESTAFNEVFKYLSEHEYPEGYDKNAKRALRQKAQSFVVVGGVLMHKTGQKLCRVVLDTDECVRIVTSLHADEVGGCHYGQQATICKVTERCWWRNVSSDTRDFVRSCAVCQKANPLNKPPPALHPEPVGGLYHRWG